MCGAFSGFCSLPPHPLLSTVYQFDGCLSSRGRGGSWLGCQVLPAIGAVSILELAANSGTSRMSQAPNLHRATKLFIQPKSTCFNPGQFGAGTKHRSQVIVAPIQKQP